MNTIELCKKIGFRHSEMLVKCRELISDVGFSEDIFLSSYLTSRGKNYPCYELSNEGVQMLASYAPSITRGATGAKLSTYLSEFGIDVIRPVYRKEKSENSFAALLERFFFNEPSIKIVRQYKIGEYFVDFYIPKLSLVIEFDEEYHSTKTQVKKDKVRQENIIKEIKRKTDGNDWPRFMRIMKGKEIESLYDLSIIVYEII